MKIKTLSALAGTLLFCLSALAQPTQFVNGQLRATFGPNGATLTNTHSFLELKDGDDWISLLYDAGLLVGGIAADGTTKLFTTRGATLEAGFRGIDAEVETPWRVTRDQIDTHRADFADNGVIDNPVPEIYAWPGRANSFSEEYNGYSLFGAGTNNLASFWDENSNGLYEPDRGDFPVLPVRGCLGFPVAPTEMMLYPILLRDGDDVFFQIYLTVFRSDCFTAGSTVNNTIYLHYKIINYSGQQLDNTYVGYWADGDLGCFTDDYVGTFADRSAVYFYNAQEMDASCEFVEDQRFSGTPAALGIDVLRGPLSDVGEEVPLSSVMPILNASFNPNAPAAITEPVTAQEYYNYLSGRWRDGQPLLDQGLGYDEGEPTDFAFTGNPATTTGWTEVGAGNVATDRKAIFSAGPFTLMPGAVNEFILGFAFSQNTTVDHLEQVAELRNRIDTLQAFFDGCLELAANSDACSSLITSADELKQPTKNQLLIYPNPARNQVNVVLPAYETGTLSVFMPNGQVLLQKRATSENLTLDLSTWPRGLYWLRWEGEQEVFVNKLLVD